MKNIKVSVIVPIYNGENYLEKSLLFLSKQTLKEIEFVLVNDASSDNSLKIMKAFKNAYPERFVIIDSKTNRGQGGARNIGLEYAKGKYIGFMDQDDFTNPQMFELLYNKAIEKNSDMVMCAFRNKELNSNMFVDTNEFKNGLTIEARNSLILHTGYIWHNIFKRDLLDSLNMFFREIYLYEDTDFLYEVYSKIKSIDFVEKALYLYNRNSESLTQRKRSLNEKWFAVEELFKSVVQRCGNSEYYEELKDALNFRMLHFSVGLFLNIIKNNGITFENIDKFNTMLKKYVPDYNNNKYVDEYDNNYDNNITVIKNYNQNSEVFYQNIRNLNIIFD